MKAQSAGNRKEHVMEASKTELERGTEASEAETAANGKGQLMLSAPVG